MSDWKRPHIEVGATVSFHKFYDSKPLAMLVTHIDEKTISGAVFSPHGAGFIPMDCVFHVDDPELQSRPQMQEAMWRHTEIHRKVNHMWEQRGLDSQVDVKEFAQKPEFRADPAPDRETKNGDDQVRQMLHAGCLDKGRICAETGVHHKRVEKMLKEFLADREDQVNG
jgi:hypothetical protein